ncbi:MAG: alpha/beta hydrolase [Clostridium sp.]
MKREEIVINHNGHNLYTYIWNNVDNPRGIVHIFHGMVEHSGRYDDFARFLNLNGYIVISSDHRGHGETAGDGELGYIGEGGFDLIVKDKKFLSDYIKNQYKDLPLTILGHSFGSFIAQEYLIRYSSEIDGIIFSGSAKNDGLDIRLGYMVSSLQSKLLDDKKPAKLIDKMAFGGFNKSVKNPKTKCDWLTRDHSQVRKYIEDEKCSFVPSINFYKNLFSGLINLYKEDRLKNIRNNIDILVISGGCDPVGKMGKSVKRLYSQYKDIGVNNTSLKLYDDGRHELLNEVNKDEVYEYILTWLNHKICYNNQVI